MRLTVTSCLATILFVSPSVPTAADLESCIQRLPGEWPACLEEFDRKAIGAEELRRLDTLVAEDPEKTLSFLDLLESTIRRGDPTLEDDPERHAELLDQQAEANRLLGNAERSAELALAALEADSGTRALVWWSVDGNRKWTAALDLTGERHERAARVLLELGRKPEARTLLTTALRLGAGGDAEALWAASGGGPVEGLDVKSQPIHATPWFPRLPRALVPLVEGEPFVLDEARGSVLILDFWASWCEPCLKELPALGQLYESEKDHGLQVVLINMGEAPGRALRFARNLGLTMPVGIYGEALEDAFDVATLPTMIVADREGRVRARWDGYGEGNETRVAALARRLLGTEAHDPGEQLGRTLRGGARLHVDWARTASGDVDGLAVVRPDGAGAPGMLIALAGRRLLSYDWRGVVAGTVDRPHGAGLLRGGDLDGNGRDVLFSFRPGGTHISRLDLEQGKHEEIQSPAPLLDLAVSPPGDTGSGSLFLATVSGLQRMTASGEATVVPGVLEPTGLAAFARPGGSGMAVISRNEGLCTLNPADTEEIHCTGGSQGWKVVAGISGSGVGGVPGGAAAVAGRFLGGKEGEVAAITSSGQLVILDIETGQERFRARMRGLRALAAGDLDGDGVDELALAVEGHVLVLAARPPMAADGESGAEIREK